MSSLPEGRGVEVAQRVVEAPAEAIVATDEIPTFQCQRRPSALDTAPGPRDHAKPERPLRVVEIGEGVPIRPARASRGGPDRPGGLDGSEQDDTPVAQRKPRARVEPDLVADREPR